MSTDTALLSLMRLVSPALPVGGFAYSQGLETAIDCGAVTTAPQVRDWVEGVMSHGLACLDVPLLVRLHGNASDPRQFSCWNDRVLASRETRELRLEEQQMGRALWRLLSDMGECLPAIKTPTWLGAFAWAAARWGIDAQRTCQGFLWAWLENQLAVAAKTVPIGQTDVQRISGELMPVINRVVEFGLAVDEGDIAGSLPGVAMLSIHHETQYSRLFRS